MKLPESRAGLSELDNGDPADNCWISGFPATIIKRSVEKRQAPFFHFALFITGTTLPAGRNCARNLIRSTASQPSRRVAATYSGARELHPPTGSGG